MRLCFICNEYPPAPHGGIGTFVHTLARHLVKLKQEVFVVGYDPSINRTSWFKENGVKVLRIRSPFRYLPAIRMGKFNSIPAFLGERFYLSKVVQNIMRSYKLDLVESYDWSGPLIMKPRVPLVVRLHGANTAYQYYEKRRPSLLLKIFERRNVCIADALVAVSNHIGTVTLKALGLNKMSFSVIYNGVDTEMFRPCSQMKDPLQVLYVGSLTRRKGIPSLFRVIPSVIRQVPGAHFKLVGRVPPGERGQNLKDELLASVPKTVRQYIHFAGFVPHVHLPMVYSSAAVAVFPSYAEAFGLTCAEAMACGTAVVMTSRASGPELVEHEVSGLLADPYEPEDLGQALVNLLVNRKLRENLGKNARQRAVKLFDLRSIIQQNLDYYKNVVVGLALK